MATFHTVYTQTHQDSDCYALSFTFRCMVYRTYKKQVSFGKFRKFVNRHWFLHLSVNALFDVQVFFNVIMTCGKLEKIVIIITIGDCLCLKRDKRFYPIFHRQVMSLLYHHILTL